MAYVRKHGGQLAIVSGERDKSEGNKVVQKTLFVFYSKDEAKAAIGEIRDNEMGFFQYLMESTYPAVRFDWKKINAGVKDKLHVLPDSYERREEDRTKEFERSLVDFTKRLVQLDPFEVIEAKRVLKEHKESLEALIEILCKRISRLEYAPDRDYEPTIEQYDTYKWRYLLRGARVPEGIEEWAEGKFHQQQYQEARKIFELLVKSFDDYAEGHNYLGLIALDERRIDDAIEHFEKTIEIGRNLFPSTISKKDYWYELSTRPYMRGLMNLALALNMAGRYEESIVVSKRLQKECGKDLTAEAHMAVSYLGIGDYKKGICQ